MDARLVVTYTIPEGKGHLVQYPRFYEALRADKEQQKRKFGRGEGRRKSKGRALKKTIGPSRPTNPIDVMRILMSTDVASVGLALEVQHRSLTDYAALGGEVGCA